MSPEAKRFLDAARVPETLQPQKFGMWTIERLAANELPAGVANSWIGYPTYTLLRHYSLRTLHLHDQDEVVMEDSERELRKHLPIWLEAKGRVLVTGLGLGCVVRGLLASPAVEHITVVEIDPKIVAIVGAEFQGNPRVQILTCDALEVEFIPELRWDYAWHDLWTDGDEALQVLHTRLFIKFADRCRRQGAWAFPRYVSRLLPWRALGAPRYRRSSQLPTPLLESVACRTTTAPARSKRISRRKVRLSKT